MLFGSRTLACSCLLVCFTSAWFACSDEQNETTSPTGDAGPTSDASDGNSDADLDDSVTDADDSDSNDGVDDTAPQRPEVAPPCDPLVELACALPWPSNLYLEPDPDRVTGFTIDFGDTTLPASRRNVHVSPIEYRRMDGYGVSVQIMAHFPGIQLDGLASEFDLDPSMEADSPSLLLEESPDGLVAVPHWLELDQQTDDDSRRILFMRPGVILKENTRYIVAFRNLRDQSGQPIPRSAAFEALLQRTTRDSPDLAFRQPIFDAIFTDLASFGVDTGELNLAWDFHTASSEALHGPMLHIRDDAFSIVGEDGPELVVTNVTAFTRDENPNMAFQLQGTIEVPHYVSDDTLNGNAAGWVLNIGEDGLPEARGTRQATWWAVVPHSAVNSDIPHGLVLYGHGLLGEGDQVFSGFNQRMANNSNLIFFGANMTGMAGEDYASIVTFVSEMSNFHWLSDRLHQGLVEHLLLARAFRERFATLDFAVDAGVTINPDELFYSGISQGGIFGATVMALTTDITHGHLGVPGNNYSFLLHRSVDFDPFFNLLRVNYPDPVEQSVLLGAIQLLWDATDPVSYLRHITAEPFAGNDPHYVLLVPAKGDFQVAVTANEIAARSNIGIQLMENYDDERTPSLITQQSYPYQGSGVVLYDFGNPWPTPDINLPHTDDIGDPHGLPRNQLWHDEQLVHFLRNGEVIDTCGGDGCRPD
jgi:hypothetical protein